MEYAIKNNNQYESVTFNSNVIQTQGKGIITLQAHLDNNDPVNVLNIRKLNTLTKLEYPTSVLMKLVSRLPFNYTVPGMVNKYYNKHKVEDFLYEITYGNIDYNYAKQSFIDTNPSGCSAIRNGNLFGRNFDWLYSNDVQFVVHTPSSLDHNAVLGVSAIIPGVNKNTVDLESITYEGKDMFKLLPFYLVDGINEKGLFCTHNVVPLDDDTDPTITVIAQKEEREVLPIPMLVRYILDNFNTAKQAIDYIRDYVTIYFTETMIYDWMFQSHFLIGDCTETYVVEFINNLLVVHKLNYITNFQIDSVEFDSDNHIQYPPTDYGVPHYGQGLERWDIISDNYKTTNTHEGMSNCLDLVKYSKGYNADSFWYSELVGKEDDEGDVITVDTNPNICSDAKEEVITNYNSRSRTDPKVWITCHSSIYDIKCRLLYIKNQEGSTEYSFSI